MPTLEVILGDNWAEFDGPGAARLYVTLFRRRPVYNTRTRRYVTVPDRVRDLCALAESRHYEVTVTGAPTTTTAHRREQFVPESAPESEALF